MDFVHGGCYHDDPVVHDLPIGPYITIHMSTAVCRTLCRDYEYFGIQNGGTCWCGDNPFTYGQGSACTVPCIVSGSSGCGGCGYE